LDYFTCPYNSFGFKFNEQIDTCKMRTLFLDEHSFLK
jgi:hypothetical protein